MKRIISAVILLFVTIFLSGCTATYDLTIHENGLITEQLRVNNKFSDDVIKTYTENPIPLSLNESCILDYDGTAATKKKKSYIKYYDVTYNNEVLTFKGENHLQQYNDTRIATSLFNNMHANYYSNLISIYGYNGLVAFLSYPELEKVVVNIKTDLEVVNNDADLVKGNQYTWYFDKNTPDTKTLYLEIKREVPKQSGESGDDTKSVWKYMGYIIIGVILLLLALAWVFKRRYSDE